MIKAKLKVILKKGVKMITKAPTIESKSTPRQVNCSDVLSVFRTVARELQGKTCSLNKKELTTKYVEEFHSSSTDSNSEVPTTLRS